MFIIGYVLAAISVPILIGAIYFWVWWIKRKHKKEKSAQKAEFGITMNKLADKYNRLLRGKDERLLSPDVISSDISRSQGSGSKKPQKKTGLFGK